MCVCVCGYVIVNITIIIDIINRKAFISDKVKREVKVLEISAALPPLAVHSVFQITPFNAKNQVRKIFFSLKFQNNQQRTNK